MNVREQWRDFITDPGRAGRHLANVGRSVVGSTAAPIDTAVLNEFLEKLSGTTADITLLAGILDLLVSEYGKFCTEQLPTLLDSLANEKLGESAIVGPGLRGNTRWDLTILGRFSGRLSQTQFATRLPVRSFGLPENALVRWLVADLVRTISWIERHIGSKGLLPQLSTIRDACAAALDHQWFREVPPPRSLDAPMRLAAQRQRLPAYRNAGVLAACRQRYHARDRAARWRNILDLLAVNWLAPLSDDDLFELYALVMVLDVLERDLGLGSPQQFGLAVPGRGHVALFGSGSSGTRVFFDQSPHVFLDVPSYQLQILAAHQGITGTSRRPDVVVVRNGPEGNRVVFVEVKKTADSSYISDSVYKALGYISDFRTLWSERPSNPKVVVVFPQNISPRPGVNLAQQEVVLASSFDRETIASSLRSALGA